MGSILVADPGAAPALFAVPGSRAAGPIVLMWGCKREDTITPHRSVLPRWSLKVQGETLGLAPCACRGKGFTRQRSQGWLLQETFPLPLKPGRESSPAAPRPATGRELPCSPTRGSASHAASLNSAGRSRSARCSRGRFAQRNGSNRAEEHAGRKRCQMLQSG